MPIKHIEELNFLNFYVSVIVEGVAVAFLVFIGGTSYVKYTQPFQTSEIFEIATVYGITLTVLSQCLKDISKAHINPAVTLANVLTRRISLLRGTCYIVFQIIGGVVGSYILRDMVPGSGARDLSVTYLSPRISLVKAVMYEMLFTLIYTWIHFASKNSRDTFKGFSGPLALGLFYGMSHVVLINITGCSLNPARSLGPAFATGYHNNIWIYIISPSIAASLIGLLHDFIIYKAKNVPYPRARSCSISCCKPGYEEVIINENIQERQSPQSNVHPNIVITNSDDVSV